MEKIEQYIQKYKSIFIFIIAIIIMILNFDKNIFISNTQERKSIKSFQLDSESLVIGGMIRDKYNINNSKYGLQLIQDVQLGNYNKYKSILKKQHDNIILTDYTSQIGMQGKIFSFLYNKLGIGLRKLHLICEICLALVLVNICRLLRKKYGDMFAIIFYVVFLLSPWIVKFAKNLYWMEFLWFLPFMLCLLLDKSKNMKLYIPLIFISVMAKCLCGYEYISTILLFAISCFIPDIILNKEERKEKIKMTLIVGIVSILAFIVVLCIHGCIRENGNIIKGIKTIYEQDILRRTMSNDPTMFSEQKVKDSIKASYTEVIKKYFNFSSEIILGVNGELFNLLCFSSALIAIYNLYVQKKNAKKEFILYLIFFLCPLSWFILAKAHSYVHTHINFVLWYFGYIQMSIYIVIKAILDVIKIYKEKEIE